MKFKYIHVLLAHRNDPTFDHVVDVDLGLMDNKFYIEISDLENAISEFPVKFNTDYLGFYFMVFDGVYVYDKDECFYRDKFISYPLYTILKGFEESSRGG